MPLSQKNEENNEHKTKKKKQNVFFALQLQSGGSVLNKFQVMNRSPNCL